MTEYRTTTKRTTGDYENPCWVTHKPLIFPCSKGNKIQLLGGNASYPNTTASIIVSLEDSAMPVVDHQFPWRKGKNWFVFPIKNMSVPEITPFKLLVNWLSVQARLGKVIHVGCVGGHGRTGLVLAAMYKHLTGDVEATRKVRTLYCGKIVESQVQVDFLHEHYGINRVPPRYKSKKPIIRPKPVITKDAFEFETDEGFDTFDETVEARLERLGFRNPANKEE